MSLLLGTRMKRFWSTTGLEGLARENVDRIDILAIISKDPGQGKFRKFVQELKKCYKTICVWHDFNPIMTDCLKRYGFQEAVEVDGMLKNETLKGWRWDRV